MDETVRNCTNPVEQAKIDILRAGYTLQWSTAVHAGVAALQEMCFGFAKKAGWWNRGVPNVPVAMRIPVQEVLDKAGYYQGSELTLEEIYGNVPEKIGLTQGELSEALEGHRRGTMDEHLPHRTALEVELADAVIRIANLTGALRMDLAGAVLEKLAYNQKRDDHKPANRALPGGKAY